MHALPEDVLTHLLKNLAYTEPKALHSIAQTSRKLRKLCAAAARIAAQELLLDHDPPWLAPTDPHHPAWVATHAAAARPSAVSWTSAPPAWTPRAAFAHSTTSWRGRLYVFGGRHDRAYFGSVSVLEPRAPTLSGDDACASCCTGWLSLTPSGEPPSPRRAHTATLHADRLYVLGGGRAAEETVGDMHSLSLECLEWRAEPAPQGWARFGHTCDLAHAADGRPLFVVVGGACKEPDAPLRADSRVGAYDLERRSWREVHTAGAAPSPRYRHAACVIGDGLDTLAVWGGYALALDGSGANSLSTADVHLLHVPSATWSSPRCTGAPPSRRGGHSLTKVGRKLIIYGGGQLNFSPALMAWAECDLDDVACLDTQTWHYDALDVRGLPPGPRGGHSASRVGVGTDMGLLILGGRHYVADTWHGAHAHYGRAEAHLLVFGDSGSLSFAAREASAMEPA